MSSIIFCEGALYGADGRELEHPNYKRQDILVSVQRGFHGTVKWFGLNGAVVSEFRLLLAEWPVMISGGPARVIDDGNVLEVDLDIAGKGDDYPDPFSPGGEEKKQA